MTRVRDAESSSDLTRARLPRKRIVSRASLIEQVIESGKDRAFTS
jgi:hypothetical protein